MSTATALRPISRIVYDIRRAWVDKNARPNVNFAAKPYLDAMSQLETASDLYGCDTAQEIVVYFLANAAAFRGDDAKALKAELKAHFPRVYK